MGGREGREGREGGGRRGGREEVERMRMREEGPLATLLQTICNSHAFYMTLRQDTYPSSRGAKPDTVEPRVPAYI